MDRPEVIVNPLSMLAPGIFRDIFQMTPFDPKVQTRDEGQGADADRERARFEHGGRADSGARHHHRVGYRRRLELADELAQEEQAVEAVRAPQTGFSSTCFFLPSDSLMVPSAATSAAVSSVFSSATGWSLTRRPPP